MTTLEEMILWGIVNILAIIMVVVSLGYYFSVRLKVTSKALANQLSKVQDQLDVVLSPDATHELEQLIQNRHLFFEDPNTVDLSRCGRIVLKSPLVVSGEGSKTISFSSTVYVCIGHIRKNKPRRIVLVCQPGNGENVSTQQTRNLISPEEAKTLQFARDQLVRRLEEKPSYRWADDLGDGLYNKIQDLILAVNICLDHDEDP